jgi:hypothetical protein
MHSRVSADLTYGLLAFEFQPGRCNAATPGASTSGPGRPQRIELGARASVSSTILIRSHIARPMTRPSLPDTRCSSMAGTRLAERSTEPTFACWWACADGDHAPSVVGAYMRSLAGTTSTDAATWPRTFLVTLPRRELQELLVPCDPSADKSAPRRSAARAISRAGLPTRVWLSASTPACLRRLAASPETRSATSFASAWRSADSGAASQNMPGAKAPEPRMDVKGDADYTDRSQGRDRERRQEALRAEGRWRTHRWREGSGAPAAIGPQERASVPRPPNT